MKIIRLVAENFKRLKAVDIRPGDDPLVKITGKNMAGKTSVLDVILAGLKGGKAIPSTPIRKGEDKGGLLLDLGDYEVIRNFTPKGNYLKVYSKPDGIKVDSPQDFLNSIIGSISFDPMEFVLMSKRPGGKKEQRELILQLAGVDTTKIDAEYATYYSQRTEVGRDVTRLKGALASKVYDDSAPTEEQRVTELSDKLQKGLVANNALNQAKQRVTSIEREITEMEEALVAKREELIAAQNAIKGKLPIDLATIQGAIKNMEAVNTKVRGNKDYLKVYDELELAMKKYDKLSASLDSLQNKKVSLLKAAKMPLEGLTVTDDEVLYNDLPLDQVSDGEGLLISTAVAMTQNPEVKVIRITKGSLIDSESMAMLEKIAAEWDFQVWIEVVGEPDAEGNYPVGVYIEEGVVAAVDGIPVDNTPIEEGVEDA